MLASLTVRILSGALAPDAWAEVEFTTSDKPLSNTSAVCKSMTVACMQEVVHLSAAPSDYISAIRRVNFTSSNTEFIINVTIINDQLVELDESFIANLSLISSVGARVIIGPDNASIVVEIISGDG